MPAPQLVQTLKPVEDAIVPSAHGKQAKLDAELLYWPNAHGLQPLLVALGAEPAEQLLQTEAPGVEE